MGRPDRSSRNGISRRGVIAVLLTGTFGAARGRADVSTVRIGYIRSMARHPTISLLDQPTPDAGIAGARLGTDDNNTTGSTLSQAFDLIDVPARKGANLLAALDGIAGQ